jgi:hypothetical protein
MILVLISCSDRDGSGEKNDNPLKPEEEPLEEVDVEDTGGVENPGISHDIGLIDELTPEVFVKLTILYRRENRRWLEHSQALTPEEQERYLERKNNEFFSRYGLEEEEYVSYSQQNIDELNEYIAEHPELMSQLMDGMDD